MNMLPVSVWAETENETATVELTAENAAVTPSEDMGQAYIVQEIVEKLTETSKEFLLSNGMHMAALYAEPVHYETENGWQEIDNTLIAADGETLINTAGVWEVTFPQTLTKDSGVTVKKDGYTLSFFMEGELTAAIAEIPVIPDIPVEMEAQVVQPEATEAAEEPTQAAAEQTEAT